MPSGVDADTGCWLTPAEGSGYLPPTWLRHALYLLTLNRVWTADRLASQMKPVV
jgi:hypothetical protein